MTLQKENIYKNYFVADNNNLNSLEKEFKQSIGTKFGFANSLDYWQ